MTDVFVLNHASRVSLKSSQPHDDGGEDEAAAVDEGMFVEAGWRGRASS